MSKEILARLTSAKEPNRMLDAMIECELRKLQAYEIGMSDKVRSHWRPIEGRGEVIDGQNLCRYHSPTYTFSVDAALQLVPNGCIWTIEPDLAVVRWLTDNDVSETSYSFSGRDGRATAIALSAAAIEARSTLLGRPRVSVE